MHYKILAILSIVLQYTIYMYIHYSNISYIHKNDAQNKTQQFACEHINIWIEFARKIKWADPPHMEIIYFRTSITLVNKMYF